MKVFASILLLLCASLASRPASGTVVIEQVTLDGFIPSSQVVTHVAVLSLSSSNLQHEFRCSSSAGSVSNLEWVTGNGSAVVFSTSRSASFLRMDLTSPRTVTAADEGYYTCRDTVTMEMRTIYISAASVAVIPALQGYVVREGGTVSMQVYTAAYPSQGSEVIQWTFGPSNSAVVTGGNVVVNSSTLIINEASITESGWYIVTFTNNFGGRTETVSTNVSLTVQVLPMLVRGPGVVVKTEHSSVVLMCEFTGSPRPSMITWEKRGGALPISLRRSITMTPFDNDTVQLFSRRSELRIFNVLVMDGGEYRCGASSNISNGTVWSTYGRLQVNHQLKLVAMVNGHPEECLASNNRLLFVMDSSSLVIKCNGTGVLNWTRASGARIPLEGVDSTPSVVSQRTDVSLSAQLLTISSFSSQQRDMYSCSTTLPDGQVIQENVFITNVRPDVYISERVVYVPAGGVASLSASIVSSTLPSVIWFFRNSSILLATSPDNSSMPYYSQTSSGSSTVLTVHNVARSVLGEYTVMVTSDGMSRRSSVTLAFLEPPRVTTTPSVAIAEGDSVTVQCVVEGVRDLVWWSGCGQTQLPEGATQSGTSLEISSAGPGHNACYNCTAANSNGASSSTTIITVYYGPVASITYNNSSVTNESGILTVVVAEGSPSHLLSCTGEGEPAPRAMWYRTSLAGAVSEEPVQLPRGTTFSYRDSGRYICVARNSRNTSRLAFTLSVTRRPSITSVFPIPPASTSSTSSFFIPEDHSGPAVTCVGTGWPRPSLQWNRGANEVATSSPPSSSFDASIDGTLDWDAELLRADGATVTCSITGEAGLNDSHTFRLDSVQQSVEFFPLECKSFSSETFFQVNVLDGARLCDMYEDKLLLLEMRLQEILLSVVESTCEECGTVEEQELMMTQSVVCGKGSSAGIFMGKVMTSSTSRTSQIVCALSRWQQSQPLIAVGGQFYQVDGDCQLYTGSAGTDGRCASETTNPAAPIVLIAIVVPIGVVVGLVVIALLLLLLLWAYKARKVDSKPSSLDSSTSKNDYIRSNLSQSEKKLQEQH